MKSRATTQESASKPPESDSGHFTDSLVVCPSPISGRGVFARRVFHRDETIEVCPVVVGPCDHEALEQTPLREMPYDRDDVSAFPL